MRAFGLSHQEFAAIGQQAEAEIVRLGDILQGLGPRAEGLLGGVGPGGGGFENLLQFAEGLPVPDGLQPQEAFQDQAETAGQVLDDVQGVGPQLGLPWISSAVRFRATRPLMPSPRGTRVWCRVVWLRPWAKATYSSWVV